MGEGQGRTMIVGFPLDVSAALRSGPSHVLWPPSSIVRRRAFFRAGGFSTDRGFGNDTQFLLRAFFKMRIRNIDDFYYIRRKHPNALTVAPSTCLELPLRVQLNKTWNADFEAVRQGRMALAQSSLRAIPSDLDHSLIPMRPRGRRYA